MEPQQPIPGLITTPTPQSDEDWFAKRMEVGQLFSPTHPVQETDLFAGRTDQMYRIFDAVFQPGQHVVLYGDRGVGKTSITNVMVKRVFARAQRTRFFSARCYAGDDFSKIWERAFKDHRWANGEYAADDIDSMFDPDGALELVEKTGPAIDPVIIFDEFDRVTDQDSKARMAETIKLLSDECPRATILIAGIGRTIRELIAEHQSIQRAVRQVQMPRMSSDEIKSIINVRLGRAAMTIEPDVLDLMVWFSRGMPGYAHLLGLHAARAAIDRKDLRINDDDLWRSLETCMEDVAESTKHAYLQAVQSSQSNKLRHTLLACATVEEHDEFGAFHAAAVRGPLSKILKEKREIPDFNRHLKAFCMERGPILERYGQPKNYKYRFIDPMMQSYVMMQGYKDKLLP